MKAETGKSDQQENQEMSDSKVMDERQAAWPEWPPYPGGGAIRAVP